MATLIAAPVLLAGLFVGLLVGLIQALTQIQEQTVAFVPKLIAMVIALGVIASHVWPEEPHSPIETGFPVFGIAGGLRPWIERAHWKPVVPTVWPICTRSRQQRWICWRKWWWPCRIE